MAQNTHSFCPATTWVSISSLFSSGFSVPASLAASEAVLDWPGVMMGVPSREVVLDASVISPMAGEREFHTVESEINFAVVGARGGSLRHCVMLKDWLSKRSCGCKSESLSCRFLDIST